MPSHDLVLPDTVPSFNRVGGSQGWRAVAKAKKNWEEQLGAALLIARCLDGLPPRLASVHATAVLRFPKRRRRDQDNYTALLAKALGDALQKGRFLDDDTPETYTFGELTFDDQVGTHRTTVTLTYEE